MIYQDWNLIRIWPITAQHPVTWSCVNQSEAALKKLIQAWNLNDVASGKNMRELWIIIRSPQKYRIRIASHHSWKQKAKYFCNWANVLNEVMMKNSSSSPCWLYSVLNYCVLNYSPPPYSCYSFFSSTITNSCPTKYNLTQLEWCVYDCWELTKMWE